jgi:hypothetical protein
MTAAAELITASSRAFSKIGMADLWMSPIRRQRQKIPKAGFSA